MGKNILIVGANFDNKGAQSMLFVTIDELKKRLPKCNIYFAGCEIFDENVYAFHELYYSENAKYIALNKYSFLLRMKCFLKDCIKPLFGKKHNLFRFNEVKNNLSKFDLMIDISGFNIGEKWSIEVQEAYLNNIRLARKFDIPMFMMPQSFGGFDYSPEKKFLLSEIKELLAYPKIIYAREKEGHRMLYENFRLTNVARSTDLVLQNAGINISNIYKNQPDIILPEIFAGAVAVIPNIQCFNHGDRDKNLKLYEKIIEKLLKENRPIYIFRHSSEDLPICKQIKELFPQKEVVLLDQNFSCIEYDELIRNFDFIICSRFHGIVHAYRNYVPSILLGWAIKYQELAQNVGQENYAFDITAHGFESDQVISAIDDLLANREIASQTIRDHLVDIQKDNCFDQVMRCLQW